MIESAHQHDCPIAAGVTLPRNIAHGEYDAMWLRGLGRKAAAEWRKPRDSQRARVYRAEHRVAVRLDEPNLESVAATQDFVDRIVASTWWRTAAPHRPTVLVADGRGRRSGGSVGGEIRLPRQYRTPLIVLHELAHEWIMCSVRAPHGPEFVTGFLALVGEFHGEDTRDILVEAFGAERVLVSASL